FLRKLDTEKNLRSDEMRLIYKRIKRDLEVLQVDEHLPQFARDHAKKMIKEISQTHIEKNASPKQSRYIGKQYWNAKKNKRRSTTIEALGKNVKSNSNSLYDLTASEEEESPCEMAK
ncbi:19933_t:CDS:2, partial [Racocetra fulgida]